MTLALAVPSQKKALGCTPLPHVSRRHAPSVALHRKFISALSYLSHERRHSPRTLSFVSYPLRDHCPQTLKMSLSENEAYAANPDESHTRFTNSQPREAIGQPEQAGRPFTQDGLTSITTLLAGLPAAQFHALPQEEYVAQWQEYMNEEYQASEIPQVQRVYCSCLDTYSVLLPVCFNFSASGEDVPESFYRNYILLRDWGSAYLVPEGQLDQLPKEASEVVETIAAFLGEISDILLQSELYQRLTCVRLC
jgi:hypothetical protein